MNEPTKSNKGKYWLVAIVLGIILALTNPAAETHKQACFDRLSQHAAQDGFGAMLGVEIGKGFILAQFEYHNYLLFSATTCGGELLTIGVLGNVLVL